MSNGEASNFPAPISVESDQTEGLRLQEQRDQALAVAWLSVTLAIAILLSNFGPPDRGTVAALKEADQLRAALANEQRGLAANEQALANVRAALNAMKPSRP